MKTLHQIGVGRRPRRTKLGSDRRVGPCPTGSISRGLRSPGLLQFVVLLIVSTFCRHLHAQIDPVVVRAPEQTAWTGQQLTFYVDIRVTGSFGGATSFSIPQVPNALVQKVGNATISSQQIEGDSYFVQSHKFALFSQETGTVEVPSFPVRYGHRDGYTGPVNEHEGTVPAIQFQIRRPPGTENLGFLVTTEELEIDESWDPIPSDAQAGAVFKRTVHQTADQISGMALAPLPQSAPSGIRLYTDDPVVQDDTERGAFRGERTETISYFMQEPGAYTLPEIRFVWWNPGKETLETKTLPSVSITVSPSPQAKPTGQQKEPTPVLMILLFTSITIVILFLIRYPTKQSFAKIRARQNRPERVEARKLMAACHANDAKAAYVAFRAIPEITITQSLASELKTLEAILYSNHNYSTWDGNAFALAFKESQRHRTIRQQKRSHLPPLNPLPNNR